VAASLLSEVVVVVIVNLVQWMLYQIGNIRQASNCVSAKLRVRIIVHGAFIQDRADQLGTTRYVDPSAFHGTDIHRRSFMARPREGVLKEHWDVLQDESTKAESVSGLPMFGDTFPK
jgi:hypothetical protein